MREDIQKNKIKNLIRGCYDIQKLRIATGNRIVQSFNQQMGQEPSTKIDDMSADAQKLITTLKKEYDRITDAYVNKSFVVERVVDDQKIEKKVTVAKNAGVEKVIKQMSSSDAASLKYIKDKLDYKLVSTYVELLHSEETMFGVLKKEVEKHPLWDAFFKGVKGCGFTMAAVCIAYFDVHKARHASSFWKYAGLDVVTVQKKDEKTGEVKSVTQGRSKSHTEMVDYTDKNGEVKQKKSITFNPELKTKLVGVLGSCFLKSPGCHYEQIYRNYRHRLDNRVDSAELTDGHKHNMANRYMIKMFVRDLWVAWRTLEGYEVSEPYEVAFLGRKPHGYNEAYDGKIA